MCSLFLAKALQIIKTNWIICSATVFPEPHCSEAYEPLDSKTHIIKYHMSFESSTSSTPKNQNTGPMYWKIDSMVSAWQHARRFHGSEQNVNQQDLQKCLRKTNAFIPSIPFILLSYLTKTIESDVKTLNHLIVLCLVAGQSGWGPIVIQFSSLTDWVVGGHEWRYSRDHLPVCLFVCFSCGRPSWTVSAWAGTSTVWRCSFNISFADHGVAPPLTYPEG